MAAHVWDYRPAEHQRVSAQIELDLRGVGIEERVPAKGRVEAAHEGSYLGRGVGLEASGKLADLARIDERLIALYVDDHVGC